DRRADRGEVRIGTLLLVVVDDERSGPDAARPTAGPTNASASAARTRPLRLLLIAPPWGPFRSRAPPGVSVSSRSSAHFHHFQRSVRPQRRNRSSRHSGYDAA